jgi:hypothetical protein
MKCVGAFPDVKIRFANSCESGKGGSEGNRLYFSPDNAITIFRIMANLPVPCAAVLSDDMDGDQKTGIAEALYFLQKTADLRD